MVALWMCYATLVTALLGAGAWAADGALAALGRPRRWAWAAAVAGGLALPAAAGWRATRVGPPTPTPAPAAVRPAAATAVGTVVVRAVASLPAAAVAPPPARPAVLRDRLTVAAAAAERSLAPLDRPLLALWLLASAAGMAFLLHGAWAVRRRRRGWRAAVVAGERVWLAPDLGPALVGALRPSVVLPAWVVDALDAGELRLVLAHERAHAAAHDPLLLAVALGALVVAPWNAALWLAARRLRLAAEADCDRRVLRAHPGARRYARLLVDVAERALGAARARGAGAMATALLDPPGLLERRVHWLLGMERGAPGGRGVRAAGAAVGALGVAALACAVPRPAPAPAPTPDVASAAPVVRSDAAGGCATDPACRDSLGVALARARAQLEHTERELRRAAVGANSKAVMEDTINASVDRSAMDRAEMRMDSTLQAAADSLGRASQTRFARVQAELQTRLQAHQAELQRAFQRAQATMLAQQAALEREAIAAQSVAAARAAPPSARALLGGAAQQPRVDSLFEQMHAAGRALARAPRAQVRFDSTVEALRKEMTRRSPGTAALPWMRGLPSDSTGFPAPAALRGLVAQHFPQALTGAMGPKPFVWFALDAQGRVTNTATGPAGLASQPLGISDWRYDPDRVERVTGDVPPAGRQLMLDSRAGHLKFPTLPPDRIGSVTWTHVEAGRDSVQVFLITPRTAR